MGVPLNNIKWTYEDPENYSYAPVDDHTRVTLRDMEKIRDKANATEDYEALKQVTKDLKIVFDLGNEILNLKRELEIVLAQEDYERGIEIRNRLKELGQERDRYDAIYETSKYEDMITMTKPSKLQAQMAAELEEEERRRLEAIRAMKQAEEDAEKRKRMEEEEAERRRQADQNQDNRQHVKKSGNKLVTIKEVKTVEVKTDPLEFNYGDDDLKPYLEPKLKEAKEKLVDLDKTVLKRALHSGTLLVTGVSCWTALHSEFWRHRDASVNAYLEFLGAPLLEKYHGKTKKIFKASIDIAREACQDKLLQIYFVGLDILEICLQSPICGDDIDAKDINEAVKWFIPHLVEKVTELNHKARDRSLSVIVNMFQNKALDIGVLIHSILDITEKGPLPDKAPQAVIQARLEVLNLVLENYGIDDSSWDWDLVLQNLIIPSFFNQNPLVKTTAKSCATQMFSIVGEKVREMVNDPELNINPLLLNDINDQFKSVETDDPKFEQQLDQVNEAGEITERSPPKSPGRSSG